MTSRRWLRSYTFHRLDVPPVRLSTVGRWAFPVSGQHQKFIVNKRKALPSMCSGNREILRAGKWYWKKASFKLCLNVDSIADVVTSDGRLFHVFAATIQNAQSPTVRRRVCGTARSADDSFWCHRLERPVSRRRWETRKKYLKGYIFATSC